MSVHIIGPDGKQHGPFGSREEAQQFGRKKWPNATCDDRGEDPNAWEVRISTRNQATVPPEVL